jgi:hypothetical protein
MQSFHSAKGPPRGPLRLHLGKWTAIGSGPRTRLGEATAAVLEIARHALRNQAFELAHWNRWLELIAPALATEKTMQDVLVLQQLHTMHRKSAK